MNMEAEPGINQPWLIWMQIHKFIIFNLNSASHITDNQAYFMLQAATPKTSGKKKKLHRAESQKSNDGNPANHYCHNLPYWYTLERCHQQRNYNFLTLCCSSENLFHITESSNKHSIKPAESKSQHQPNYYLAESG